MNPEAFLAIRHKGTDSNDLKVSSDNSTFHQNLSVHYDLPVTSMSVSPSGKEVVLAAKKGLYIVDLEDFNSEPRFLRHVSKWEVSDVQWNPHASRAAWIASTSNQKAIIWNIANNNHIEHILHAHKRAVSDLNWSIFHADILATCSYDSYVHIWDLRVNCKKPTTSFCAWTAGATQVKWNKRNEYTIASSHDGDIRIWDTRKGSSPLLIITAHASKIYGIDWSWSDQNKILSCGQDSLLKVWDIEHPRSCQSCISLSAPAWRARFTPFGDGITTMSQKKECELLLWNASRLDAPVHSFSGHTEIPREFVWRRKVDMNNQAQYQLISWSKDQTLRLWTLNSAIIDSVRDVNESTIKNVTEPINIEIESEKHTSMNSLEIFRHESVAISDIDDAANIWVERRGMNDVYRNGSKHKNNSKIMNFDDEIADIKSNFPSVTFDMVDLNARRCTIVLQSIIDNDIPISFSNSVTALANAILHIDIFFPEEYPNVNPIFEIQKTGIVSMAKRTFLINAINTIASCCAIKGQWCLQSCIEFLRSGSEANQKRMGPTISDSSDDLSENAPITTRKENKPSPGEKQFFSRSENETSEDEDDFSVLGLKTKKIYGSNNLRENILYQSADSYVPFPRLCGATFTRTGKLIHFFSPLMSSAHKISNTQLNNDNVMASIKAHQSVEHPKSYSMYNNNHSKAIVLSSESDQKLKPNPILARIAIPPISKNPYSMLGVDSMSASALDMRDRLRTDAFSLLQYVGISSKSSLGNIVPQDDHHFVKSTESTSSYEIESALERPKAASIHIPGKIQESSPPVESLNELPRKSLDSKVNLLPPRPTFKLGSFDSVDSNEGFQKNSRILNSKMGSASSITRANNLFFDHPSSFSIESTVFRVQIMDLSLILPVKMDSLSISINDPDLLTSLTVADQIKHRQYLTTIWQMLLKIEQGCTQKDKGRRRSGRSSSSAQSLKTSDYDSSILKPIRLVIHEILTYLKSIGDYKSISIIHCRFRKYISETEDISKYIEAYVNTLYSDNDIENAVEILKTARLSTQIAAQELFIDIILICQICNSHMDAKAKTFCRQCERKSTMMCSLCLKRCTGNVVFCVKCGHGGHTKHLADWFKSENECPTGCSCICQFE